MIPGATFVDDLEPYIERKLFTVNTGHAAAAYFGFEAGLGKISEAMADQDVAADVRAVLDETKELLVAKHGFNRDGAGGLRGEDPGPLLQPAPAGHRQPGGPCAAAQAQPARALHRPAAELAERGIVPEALLGAIAAALRFNDPADAEAVELAQILSASTPDEATERITGLAAGPPAVRRRLLPHRGGQGGRLAAPAQRRSLRSRGLLARRSLR